MNHNSPKVSVALTTYNGSEYLEAQMESILEQIRKPDEVVISDDNSRNDTWGLLKEYKQNHPDLIRIIQNEENVGVTKNYQNAISECTGDLIALSDQDDIWREDKLQIQVQTHLETDCMLSFHDSEVVSESLEQIDYHWNYVAYKKGLVDNPSTAVKKLINHNFVKGSTILMSESLRDYALPIPSQWTYDRYLAIISILLGEVVDIKEPLHKYRRHDNQVSNHHTNSTIERLLRGVSTFENLEHYEQNAEMWQELIDVVQELPNEEMNIDIENVEKVVNERIQYDLNRGSVYSNDGLGCKMRNIVENTSSGWYSRYENIHPVFYIVKDLITAILSTTPKIYLEEDRVDSQ